MTFDEAQTLFTEHGAKVVEFIRTDFHASSGVEVTVVVRGNKNDIIEAVRDYKVSYFGDAWLGPFSPAIKVRIGFS